MVQLHTRNHPYHTLSQDVALRSCEQWNETRFGHLCARLRDGGVGVLDYLQADWRTDFPQGLCREVLDHKLNDPPGEGLDISGRINPSNNPVPPLGHGDHLALYHPHHPHHGITVLQITFRAHRSVDSSVYLPPRASDPNLQDDWFI